MIRVLRESVGNQHTRNSREYTQRDKNHQNQGNTNRNNPKQNSSNCADCGCDNVFETENGVSLRRSVPFFMMTDIREERSWVEALWLRGLSLQWRLGWSGSVVVPARLFHRARVHGPLAVWFRRTRLYPHPIRSFMASA